MISRPTLFGPEPEEIKNAVYDSLPYRLMAHTAEDLCELCMPQAELERCGHDDVRHGFVISFPEEAPNFDIGEMEQKVNEMIRQDLPITYVNSNHVSIGGTVHLCTGPRIHVNRTGQIQGFRLLNHFIYDSLNRRYLLVGSVGEDSEENLRKLDVQQRPKADWMF
jgi:hypothetical protein